MQYYHKDVNGEIKVKKIQDASYGLPKKDIDYTKE